MLRGSDDIFPTSKLYCSDINKYGDIALGFENVLVLLSYNPDKTMKSKGVPKYDTHLIVDSNGSISKKINLKKIESITSCDGKLAGSKFVISSVSFDYNGDLLASYMDYIDGGDIIQNHHTGLIYVPYTPQYDGLRNPKMYKKYKNSTNTNNGISLIIPFTTGTKDQEHANDKSNFSNFSSDTFKFTSSILNSELPICEFEQISSAQLSYDGNYIVFSSSRIGSKGNFIPNSWSNKNFKNIISYTFIMKKQLNNINDPNYNLATKTYNPDTYNNSGFFISKFYPLHFDSNVNADNNMYIHNYVAINKENSVALSSDVHWSDSKSVIEVSSSNLDKIYSSPYIENTNIQFPPNEYNTSGLDLQLPNSNIKKFIDHTNYLTTNYTSDNFYGIASSTKQQYNTNDETSQSNCGVVALKGRKNSYTLTTLEMSVATSNFPSQNQYFNDLTISGNNLIGAGTTSIYNDEAVKNSLLPSVNSAFVFNNDITYRDALTNLYCVEKNATLSGEASPNVIRYEENKSNMTIKFNKFSSETSKTHDIVISSDSSGSGQGYLLISHDLNDPNSPKKNINFIPLIPEKKSNTLPKNGSKEVHLIITIFISLLVIFIFFMIFMSFYFLVWKNKYKIMLVLLNSKNSKKNKNNKVKKSKIKNVSKNKNIFKK